MAFIRTKKRENPFVQIDRGCFEDESISLKAKGLMGYMLSRPDNWKINRADLIKRSTDGARSVASALKELQEAGYIDYYPEYKNGVISQWIYDVYESPEFNPNYPRLEDPLSENLDAQNVEVQNVEVQNVEVQNGIYNNKDFNNKDFNNNKNNNNKDQSIIDIAPELKNYLDKKQADRSIDDNDFKVIVSVFEDYKTKIDVGTFILKVGDVLKARIIMKVKNLDSYFRKTLKVHLQEYGAPRPPQETKRASLPKWMKDEEKSEDKPSPESEKDLKSELSFEELLEIRRKQKEQEQMRG